MEGHPPQGLQSLSEAYNAVPYQSTRHPFGPNSPQNDGNVHVGCKNHDKPRNEGSQHQTGICKMVSACLFQLHKVITTVVLAIYLEKTGFLYNFVRNAKDKMVHD